MKIFIDTSAWVALENKKDIHLIKILNKWALQKDLS
jgi:predicted nucleic acid-binding protein